MRLHDLAPQRRSRRRTVRKGRGPGSGHGKTATKGHKGQLARSGGGKKPGFEGGQQPIIRRVPKRGFRLPARERWAIFSVGRLSALTGDHVTPEQLHRNGLITPADVRLKILGDGEMNRAMTVTAHAFSASAKAKIEAAGGTIKVIDNV